MLLETDSVDFLVSPFFGVSKDIDVLSEKRWLRVWAQPKYHLVIQHSYGKPPCLMGKSTINGPFSMAMLNYQRVVDYYELIINQQGFSGPSAVHNPTVAKHIQTSLA